MIDTLMPLIKQFLPFAQERMRFERPPKLFLRGDSKNAENPLGKTAFYDPGAKSVTLYVTGRHPKDVMRSLSHELVHHTQNCRGDFDHAGEMGEGYAQNDAQLREMEREAYEVGNMCFRDWEDSIKSTIYFEHLHKGENKMSIKDWKNNEISQLLSEAWGFKFKSLQEFDEFNGTGEIQEDESDLEEGHAQHQKRRAPRGVSPDRTTSPTQASRLSGREPEQDTEDEEEEEEQVAEAVAEEDEELEEQSKTNRPDRVAGRDTSGRRLDEDGDDLKEAILTVLKKHF